MSIPTAKEAKEIAHRNSTSHIDRMVEEAGKEIFDAASQGREHVILAWNNKEFFEYDDRETIITFKERLNAIGYTVSFVFDNCAYPGGIRAVKISWE